ncbi:hypothetical protein B0H11DRAFT_2025474, partial [Mycena galericulata]
MLRTLFWPAFLLSLPFLATCSALEEQQILSVPRPGTLRRFRPNSTQSLAEVLRIAQTHGLDNLANPRRINGWDSWFWGRSMRG